MLKKKNRLTKKEFDEVFKNGQKKFSRNFMFLKLEKENDLKISTSVSKKIYKKAVQRNEARRKVYKILQENFEKLPQNFWGALIMIKPILEIEKEKLEKEIFWILKNQNKTKK